MNIRSIAVITGLFLMLTSACSAGSIWAKRNKNKKDLYADDKAYRIGDVLTVVVTEDSKVENKANRDLKKDTSRSSSFNGELGSFADVGDFELEASSSNQLKGKADYKDERSFTDSVTVVVVDVMPNGNLVILGNRSRDIAGDKQLIEVSGIVRPSDVEFDNTVASERVADFRIVTKNSGIAEPYTRQGWLARLLDVLWPL